MLPEKMHFKNCALKNIHFQNLTCKGWISKVFYISFHIFCLLRENFWNISKKNKLFYTFPYKEVKLSKLKYFLIIIKRYFFTFYNIFFHTQPVYSFHLLRNFCNLYHIATFFFFFRKTLIFFLRLFFSFSLSSWQYLADRFLDMFIYTKKKHL